ncbi:MAG: AAA family ATPase [Pirellulaceae bacterium]|nr:AAA family ATPase [Pirellulaceae bacterium]
MVTLEREYSGHRHIGPVRTRPPRDFIAVPISEIEPNWWYDGIAAWHFYCHTTDDNQIWISDWLGPDHLDTGIELRCRRFLDEQRIYDFLADSGIKFGQDIPNLLFSEALLRATTSYRTIEAIPLRGQDIADLSSTAFSISEIGFGLSQIVPIVVTCLIRIGALISMEEPESHVHPRLQARLGDLLIDSTSNKVNYGTPNQIIVETHSEHIILRLQRRIRETTAGNAPESLDVDSDDIAVNYVGMEKGVSFTRRIELDKHGEFVQPWPDDFFDLDINERFGDAR